MKAQKALSICFILLFTHLNWLSSQSAQLNILSIGRAEGLPTRWTHCAIEDDQGIIWIGTKKGVSRFDGLRVSNFNRFNSPLRHSASHLLFKDSNGLIWTHGFKDDTRVYRDSSFDFTRYHNISDVDIIDPLTLEIRTFDSVFPDAPFAESEIRILEQIGDQLWIGTWDGKYYLYGSDFVETPKSIDMNVCEYILPDSEGVLWGFFSNQVYKDDAQSGKTLMFQSPKGMKVRSFSMSEGYLWILSEKRENQKTIQLDIIDTKTNKQTTLSCAKAQLNQDNGLVFRVMQPSKIGDEFYVRIYSDIFKIDSSLNCTSILKEVDGPNFIYSNNKEVYISTSDGIIVQSDYQARFKNHLKNEDYSIETRAIFEYNNSIVTGNSTGVLDLNTGASVFPKDHKVNLLKSVIRQSDSTLLACGYNYVMTVEEKNETITKIPNQSNNTLIKIALCEDHRDNIHIGTNKGMWIYDPVKSIVRKNEKLQENNILNNTQVEFIHSNETSLWMATRNGLFEYNYNQDTIIHYKSGIELPYDHIMHITENDGKFWLATHGGGLVEWKIGTRDWKQLTIEQGLSNDFCHASYFDDYGNLWVSSDYGIIRLDTSSQQAYTYTEKDGILEPEFNRYSHFQDSLGRIYFGSVDGVVSFNPKDFTSETFEKHDLIFTDVRVFDKSEGTVVSKITTLRNDEIIVLTDDDVFIEFEFSNTDYFTNDNAYAYRLDPLIDEWIYQLDNRVRLVELPYGTYDFKVRKPKSGYDELSVTLEVVRPWYLSVTAKALGFLMILGTGFLINQFRIRRLAVNNKLLEDLVNQKTAELRKLTKSKDRLFTLILHDLRGPIASFNNIGKKINYLIKKQQWDKLNRMSDQVQSKTENLNTLAATLIPWMTAQISENPLEMTVVRPCLIIAELIQEFEFMLLQKEIEIENQVDPNIEIYADQVSVHAILRNIISNAIKFSHIGGTIECTAIEDGPLVHLKVIDHGVGMDMTEIDLETDTLESRVGTNGEQGLGLGLKLIKDLVVRNGGDLLMHSKIGIGTISTISLRKNNANI